MFVPERLDSQQHHVYGYGRAADWLAAMLQPVVVVYLVREKAIRRDDTMEPTNRWPVPVGTGARSCYGQTVYG